MRRGDPLYRLVLREEIRLGTLAYAGLAGSRPVQAVIVRAVLAVLLSDANRAGVCWPSLRRISECAEVSRVSATRALSALEARGLIRRERRAFSPEDGRKGRSTVYRLQWAALEALAGMDSASPGSAPGVRCASPGSARALPTDTRTNLVESNARARDAARRRKDIGDGPDDPDEGGTVTFSEAVRRMAEAGDAYAIKAAQVIGQRIDARA